MAAPYQAVILAAGRGSRLHEHTHEIPKALLPIGPRALNDKTKTRISCAARSSCCTHSASDRS